MTGSAARRREALAAVVLAGGAARRLGGADKSSFVVGGRMLLASVVEAAVSAGASRVVVVGPVRGGLIEPVSFITEEPAGGGPVPALRAGLGLVSEPWVLLLASDLPFLTGQVLRELAAAGPAVVVDGEGRPQWLTSCWPTSDLRTALSSYEGNSLRDLLAPLRYAEAAVPAGAGVAPCWLDCDTPEDLAVARSWAGDLAELPGGIPATNEVPA